MLLNFFTSFFQKQSPVELDYDDYAACKAFYLSKYPEMRKLLIGEKQRDVICNRDIDDPRFNTNIQSYIGGLEEMNWGYAGTGPWLLAGNILYTFTDGDQRFAGKYVFDFREDFLIRNGDQSSFSISASEINQWINNKRQGAAIVQ